MNIQTVSYLKANANNLSLDDPLHVTQNGKEVYVVQDSQAYYEQQLKLAKLGIQGECVACEDRTCEHCQIRDSHIPETVEQMANLIEQLRQTK